VVEDYGAAGLTLRAHPLALLRPELDRLRLADTRLLATLRPGGWIRLPGLVLMRQRPGTAKGIVFVTLEDEHGQANIVVYAQVGERDRAALIGARLLVVEGRGERQTEGAEVPILHVIARRLIDRSDLLDGLRRSDAGDAAWAERGLGRADEVRRPDPGSAAPRPVLGKSRDFR
jgi:error-prone DNA polymerase